MIRPRFRALLAPAAVAAAIALAGCNPSDIPTNGRALAPLSDKMVALIASKDMDKNSPILIRIFKEESEMEVWKKDRSGQYALLKTYPICRWSGALGPKKKQGDRQAPEGFYTITPAQMNPNSNYYLAFNTGYPNAYDRAHGYTGSELMVHGDCSSAGCYAMTDEQIQEIYALARDSFFGGQRAFQLEAFPFRMTALNMAKHRNNPNFKFWKMLKQGYDDFNATRQEPKVAVCEKRYVFDAAPPAGSSRPLSFYPRGKCPVYRLDPTVAGAVLAYRQQQQIKMAKYIAQGVPTVPIRKGIDGGMNPVFATQLASLGDRPAPGGVYDVYGKNAPGALPHVPNPSVPISEMQGVLPRGVTPPDIDSSSSAPATATPAPTTPAAAPAQPAAPVMTASVPLPKKPPAAKAGLPALRGGRTELAARPRHAEPMHTASVPAARHARLASKAPAKPAHKPRAVARNTPESHPKPAVKQAEQKPPVQQAKQEPAPQLRTAYTTPVANSYGLMSGAQPVVPAGSFDARWDAMMR